MSKKLAASDYQLEMMQSMQGHTTHYAMALVSYITLKRSSSKGHWDILALLGVNGGRFNSWAFRNFGLRITEVAGLLLDGKPVPVLESHSDKSAKAAIDFISGNKS